MRPITIRNTKKAQADLATDVIIGVIILVALIVGFWLLSSKLEEMKNKKITDSHNNDIVDSFIPMLIKMNRSLYDEYTPITIELKNYDDSNNIFAEKEYVTFKGDIVTNENFNDKMPFKKSYLILPYRKSAIEIPSIVIVNPYSAELMVNYQNRGAYLMFLDKTDK